MIELGSFCAHFSLWFRSHITNGKNICVEPELRNHLYGLTNAEINGLETDFVFQNSYIGAHLSNNTRPPTTTIDYIVEQFSLAQVDILHSDIQGAEANMILGARDTFLKGKVRFSFVSTHSEDLHSRCRSLIRSYGYETPVDIPPFGDFHPDGLLVAANNAVDLEFLSMVANEMKLPSAAEEFSRL